MPFKKTDQREVQCTIRGNIGTCNTEGISPGNRIRVLGQGGRLPPCEQSEVQADTVQASCSMNPGSVTVCRLLNALDNLQDVRTIRHH